jgi:hypothetical protein
MTTPNSDAASTSEPLWESCPDCIEHFYSNGASLFRAFASVGIEYGKSQFQMAEMYFDTYHSRGHRER